MTVCALSAHIPTPISITTPPSAQVAGRCVHDGLWGSHPRLPARTTPPNFHQGRGPSEHGASGPSAAAAGDTFAAVGRQPEIGPY